VEIPVRPSQRILRLSATLAVLAACATNPVTGRRELSLVSEAQEIQMGRQYDQQIVAEMGLYPDSGWQRYVQELGSRLAAGSERPHLPWTFRVVDDPVVNAFALPGGFIYVTRGILAHFNTEAQLAGVLGHEIGHVTARHSVQQLTTQTLAQAGLVVGVLLRPELADYAGLASGALGVMFLKFGRDDESQADELGFRYMRRQRYDPRELAEVFATLERVSAASGGGRVPEWASTHPDPVNRRDKALARADTVPAAELENALVRRDEYLRRLDGLVFGPNPREGYFKGTRFLHPELRFELTFPDGWKTANQKSAVVGVSAAEDAILQLALAEQASPAEAARAFFAQQGVSGSPAASTVNGLPAAGGGFSATTENGVLRGRAVFVQHGNAVFQLLIYAADANWTGYDAVAARAIQSFRPVTDPAVLNVQPWRLDIVTTDRTMTPAEFAQRNPGPVGADVLALVNQVNEGGRFMARNLVKRVVGQPLP
jgi:predicted Zn-dependent protease